MTLTTIPGYNQLFGKAPKTYEQFLDGIPSVLIISLLIGINAEMYADMPDTENQRRMRDMFNDNLTAEQAAFVNNGFLRYKKRNPEYEGVFFGNRYIVDMCLKELNRNDRTAKTNITYDDAFNILQAYFLVVQELNDDDEQRYKLFKSFPKDENYDYRLLWAGLINKFELTDEPHPAFNVYKLLQFSLYAAEKFKDRFKEYLNKFGFATPYEFLSSFTILAKYVLREDPKKLFRKVNFIPSKELSKNLHLADMDLVEKIKLFYLISPKCFVNKKKRPPASKVPASL